MKIEKECVLTLVQAGKERLNYPDFVNNFLKVMVLQVIFFGLYACSDNQETPKNPMKIKGRWYDAAQLTLGERVYKENCISCHLEDAKGTLEWRKTVDGAYPPPPLNGTAHAWHHSIDVLLTSINEGGVPFGGVMPAFKSSLSEEQKLAVIAYFQNFWPEDIYSRWAENQGEY
jgi:mono/diheme cytochrome c family protein